MISRFEADRNSNSPESRLSNNSNRSLTDARQSTIYCTSTRSLFWRGGKERIRQWKELDEFCDGPSSRSLKAIAHERERFYLDPRRNWRALDIQRYAESLTDIEKIPMFHKRPCNYQNSSSSREFMGLLNIFLDSENTRGFRESPCLLCEPPKPICRSNSGRPVAGLRK
jgi:hypothetical protein